MENKTFEANFTTVGTPDIRIYRVNKGVYTLVKTDTMDATPETGKYSYEYTKLNQLQDYSARMELGTESIDGVYNGIFSTILNRTVERGGGGGNVKLTKEELERIVAEMSILFKDSLAGVEISLPDGLGEAEIAGAVLRIEKEGKRLLGELRAEFDNKEEVEFDTKDLEAKIENISKEQERLSSGMKEEIIKEMVGSIAGQEEKFKGFAKLLGAFRAEQKEEATRFAKLLGAFRNEMKT